MKRIGKWVKAAVQQVFDPDRDQRIHELAASLWKGLQTSGKEFSIKTFASQVDCTDRDLELAKRMVYQTVLARAWRDDKVTESEQVTINWVIDRLKIPKREAVSIQNSVARDRFGAALSRAMSDGMLDDDEAKRLEQIATSASLTLGDFVSTYFRTEGEEFLRAIFTACTERGVLSADAWTRLVVTTQRLGLSKSDLLVAVRPQAERFVEHVLADAKSDGELSEGEETTLLDIIRRLELPPDSSRYVRHSVAALRTIRLARQGRLPIIDSPPGVAVRSGEIVHFHARATWLQKRILKSGDRWDEHIGALAITDNRILFSSDTRSFDVRFARIVRHDGKAGVIRLQRMEKPESIITVAEDEPIAYAILEGAVALSNQTRLAQDGGLPSRHIPRDVRQRVWQRYGGRCAECGDAQYLEFDHIIPVAKGGSNMDSNVQLLCRACNQKKSDFI